MWFKKLFAKPTPQKRYAVPPVTSDVIAEAKKLPNGWVYAIDGVRDPNGDVPPERIQGAWQVDANGDVEGEFIFNPNYRPL
jgi:hypothetical protein